MNDEQSKEYENKAGLLTAELNVNPNEIWINRMPPQTDEPQPKEVELTLTVTNTTRTTFSTEHKNSCIFRFWILKGRTEVWRTEEICLDVITPITINPGESKTGKDVWRIPDARDLELGDYTAFGEFIPTELEDQGEIRVDEAV